MNKYLEKINFILNDHLNQYFKNDTMKEVILYSLKDGKKIRPSISFDICNSLLKSTKNVELPSLLVEYLHTASLLIDDLPCMDNANFRRNNLTNHIKFGEAITQISSIIYFSLALDALNEGIAFLISINEEDKQNNMQIGLDIFSDVSRLLGHSGIAGGQLIDLTFTNKKVANVYNKSVDLKEMIIKKTGALFELSFLIGWLFGKGDIKKKDKIKNIAYNFSLIYQILDDIEDIKEDDAGKNYVLTYGKDESIKECFEYINKFKTEMIELEIYSEYFIELTKYMEKKLNTFIENS